MRHRSLLVAVLFVVLPVLAFAAPPFERMVGANFVFRPSGCSATLFQGPDRWVLTNYHCVERSINVVERDEAQPDGTVKKVKRIWYDEVTLSQPAYGPTGKVGELTLWAKVLAFSEQKDLAVLQILSETSSLPHVATLPPDNYQLQQGQIVYAIGNPVRLENTLTRGILSHLYRELRWSADQVARYIQTDATIAGGSSGGALYDEEGQFIGMPSAGYRGAAINFAIPIWEIKTFLRDNGFAQAWDATAPSRDEWLKEQEKKAKGEKKD